MSLYGSGADYCDCGYWLDNMSISNMTKPDYFYGLEIVFVIYCFYIAYCARTMSKYEKENILEQKTIIEACQKKREIQQQSETSGRNFFV